MRAKYIFGIFTAALLSIILLFRNTLTTGADDLVLVTKVIDGDTIEIEGGQRVRYIGIDTPEIDKECYATEALRENAKLVKGKMVYLEKDVSETDKYGRLLRYVYINNIFVNEYLVQKGYAHASSYPPDIKYQDLLTQAESIAREAGEGLWSDVCGESIVNQECKIKGNISFSSGQKIYHLPSCPDYASTKINENKGEMWFCTEQEATDLGWRRAKNCP